MNTENISNAKVWTVPTQVFMLRPVFAKTNKKKTLIFFKNIVILFQNMLIYFFRINYIIADKLISIRNVLLKLL